MATALHARDATRHHSRRTPAAGPSAQREGACRAPCDCVYAARESERASETACARASTDRQATAPHAPVDSSAVDRQRSRTQDLEMPPSQEKKKCRGKGRGVGPAAGCLGRGAGARDAARRLLAGRWRMLLARWVRARPNAAAQASPSSGAQHRTFGCARACARPRAVCVRGMRVRRRAPMPSVRPAAPMRVVRAGANVACSRGTALCAGVRHLQLVRANERCGRAL